MARKTVIERVDRLENALTRLAEQVTLLTIDVKEHEERLRELEELVKRSIESTEEFKEEMKMFKDEMLGFKNEMKMFKDEMLEFKNEMRDFKDEMNKKWGWVINKLGTLVEDLFYPSIDSAVKKHFGCEEPEKFLRVRLKCIEIDILVLCGDRAYVVEVKTSPDELKYFERFKEKLSRVKECVKWLRDYKIIGVYSGWNMGEDTIRHVSESGVYAMVVRGDILDVVNPDIVPTEW